MSAPAISVVIPMFNEEAYVRRAVEAARAALEPLGGEWEIVLVDDASTDATGALAQALAGEDARVRVLHNPRNRTLGGTLRAGLAAARGQVVLYTDADLPADLQQLPRALHLLDYQEAELLAGYRFDRTGEGLRRALLARTYNLLLRVCFGLRVRDVNFAFKLIRRSLLDRIALTSEGSFIDAELVLRARRAGARVIQMGLDYFPRTRGASTLSSPRVVLGILREMARSWRELR
ncbi:MAG TPA: glycosyltransferase family 2 protein [Vicinamibacteria bacterium]|nr:glycosyltransferase family 2 protein [Vicinamibacteria bacterium]